jgi:hypothetical protein
LCGRRCLAETAVGRCKAIIGPKLRARILPAQQGEAIVDQRPSDADRSKHRDDMVLV